MASPSPLAYRDGELWLAVETTQDRAWCPDCGVRATGNGRRRVLVRDLPIAGADGVGVVEAHLALPRGRLSAWVVVGDIAAHRHGRR